MEEFLGEDDSISADIVYGLERTKGSISFVEDSFSEFTRQELPASTPTKAATGSHSKKRSTSGAEPAPRLPCPKCERTYANERTLGVHMKMHTMKDVLYRMPPEDVILNKGNDLFEVVIGIIIEEEKKTGEYPEVLKYCQVLLEPSYKSRRAPLLGFLVESFFKCSKSQNPLMPSALRSSLLLKCNQFLLTSADFEQTFKSFLFKIHPTDNATANLLLGPIVTKLFEHIHTFILKEMRGAEDRDTDIFKRSSDKIDSIHFQQLVYYISGFILNSIIYKVKTEKSESCKSWSAYADVIGKQFFSSPGKECSSEVSLFTRKKNRGGLKHCSSKALDFFLVLFDLLITLENEQGSLSFKLVDKKVSSHDDLLLLWDELVGSELTEQQSLDVLIITVDACTKTTNRGIMKRRLNEVFTKNQASIAFRPRLAK